MACGFCCTGVLFAGVRLGEDEARDAARLRLPIHHDEDGAALAFPCPAHEGACSIYEQRPATCRTYRCDLLDRVERGDIDRAGALDRVARLRAMVDRITPHLGEGAGDFWTRADALLQRPLAWQIENEALLLEIATLREMLAHFLDVRTRRGAGKAG